MKTKTEAKRMECPTCKKKIDHIEVSDGMGGVKMRIGKKCGNCSTEAKHTPTPRYYNAGFGEIRYGIPDTVDELKLNKMGENQHVCRATNWHAMDNTAHRRIDALVRAVNSHEALLAVAKTALHFINHEQDLKSEEFMRGLLIKAIALAEGKGE